VTLASETSCVGPNLFANLTTAAYALVELPASSSTSAYLTAELQAGPTYTLIDTGEHARADFTPR
jgi:hypothetical protein